MKVKSLKKILSVIIFAFMLVISVFTMTACNLVVTDKTAYYDQIIATYKYGDKTLEVSMTDLNNTFKNYGYSRYNSGYYSSLEECINDSLKYHMQTSLLFIDIANSLNNAYNDTDNEYYHNELLNVNFVDFENYDWSKTLSNIYASNTANALEIRYDAFESMQSTIDSYAEDILEEEGRLGEIDTNSGEPLRPEKEKYESNLVIDQETKEISKKVEEIKLFDKSDIPTHFELSNNYDEEVTAKAYNKYVKLLQQTAKSENRSTKVEDVILYEEGNYIKSAYQTKLLEIHQYYYESNLDITTDNVVEYYKNQYRSQYLSFEYNMDAYRTAMDEYNSEYVFYHANSGNEYIIVSHILINFSEEQKAEIAKLDTKLEADKKIAGNDEDLIAKLEEQYNKDVVAIILKTKSVYEIDGKEESAYVGDIISNINQYVTTNGLSNSVLDSDEVVKQKAKNFEDMMYIYNDDPGIMNADFYYAVNVNEGVEDNWEEAFTEGALELYSDYEVGDVLLRPAVSSYGIHIMFYSGMANNIVASNSINNLTYETLLSYTVNPASEKTIFEYLYDKIETDDYYNNYVDGIFNQMYNESDPTIDEYKFSSLWK